MPGVAAVFDGIGWVWAVWAVGVLVLVRALIGGAMSFQFPSLRALARDEEGLSYSLSYVLVFPIYLAFVCMVFTASMLILAKVGTLYAAHAGARSAVVWQTAQPASLREERIQQSVFTAMAPYVSASSRDLLTARSLPPASASQQGLEFVAAYELYSQGNQQPALRRPYQRQVASPAYLGRKFANAATRTTHSIGGDRNVPGGPLTMTVTYRCPIYIPGANRFLDTNGFWPYEMEIRSVATLPNETPMTTSRTLGIDYRSR